MHTCLTANKAGTFKSGHLNDHGHLNDSHLPRHPVRESSEGTVLSVRMRIRLLLLHALVMDQVLTMEYAQRPLDSRFAGCSCSLGKPVVSLHIPKAELP